MFMAQVEPPRYRNRIKTRPICEQCLDDGEREIAAGITSYVPCYGCGRPMAPLVPGFRRTTCSPACAMRVERRRLPKPQPPPTQTCPRCGHKFIPKHRDKALYWRPRCRHRAKDDRRLALERANRTRPRLAHPAAHAGFFSSSSR
jgi:hypothetical protein